MGVTSAGQPQSTAPRAAIFDLGGVVLESPIAYLVEFERAAGLPPGFIASLVGSYGESDEPNPWHELERGELPVEAFCEVFAEQARVRGHALDVRAMMEGVSSFCAIRPTMVEAIRRLRRRGVKVAALTNIWAAPGGFDERLNALQAEFDAFVESYRVGMRKPEAGIFDAACTALDVAATETVFLDDIGSNVKAARALGMTTIKVDSPEQALAELGALFDIDLTPSAQPNPTANPGASSGANPRANPHA